MFVLHILSALTLLESDDIVLTTCNVLDTLSSLDYKNIFTPGGTVHTYLLYVICISTAEIITLSSV